MNMYTLCDLGAKNAKDNTVYKIPLPFFIYFLSLKIKQGKVNN